MSTASVQTMAATTSAFIARNWRDPIKTAHARSRDGDADSHLWQVHLRAARAGLRHDDGQRPAPGAVVVAAGCGHHRGQDRRCGARVHVAARGGRGRDRHRAQPQRGHHSLPRWQTPHGSPRQGRRRQGDGKGHCLPRGRRDLEPRSPHHDLLQGRQGAHGARDWHRAGLRPGRTEQAAQHGGRGDPHRFAVLPDPQGQLRRDQRARRPTDRL